MWHSQEIANAKKVSLGSCTVPTNTRQNPDSSTGLAVNSELRAKARIVSNNKIAHKKQEEEKKKQQLRKLALLTARRQKAFDKVRATVASKGGDLTLALSSHSSGDDIKEAFAFCGGKAATLTGGKRATFITAIVQHHSVSFVGAVDHGDCGVGPSDECDGRSSTNEDPQEGLEAENI